KSELLVLEGDELAGAIGRVLEHELRDLQPVEIRPERLVAAAQQCPLVTAPVSAADVQPEAQTADPRHHLVDQRDGKVELLRRIPAGGKRRTHERSRPAWRKGDLRQNGLVELYELRAGRLQLLKLRAEERHDVPGESLFVRIVRARQLRHE